MTKQEIINLVCMGKSLTMALTKEDAASLRASFGNDSNLPKISVTLTGGGNYQIIMAHLKKDAIKQYELVEIVEPNTDGNMKV